MKDVAATTDRIVQAAVDVATEASVGLLTIGKVADRAGVSTALVHYHFDTKLQLLVAMAEQMAKSRIGRRETAIGGARAVTALDALWEQVAQDGSSGSERAWLELQAMARDDASIRSVMSAHRAAERAALAANLPALLRELGSSAALGAEETAGALIAVLDGAGTAITAGETPASVRAAYDAFWLALIAAGQSGRRR